MRSLRKLKGRRGTTLVEVLLVVALISALLGIAAPNLLSERREIKLAELNGNARAVAVAVQSKLYGMKSAGTAEESFYYTLTNKASIAVTIQVQGEEKELRLLSNFACRAVEKEEENPSEGSGSGDDGTPERGDDYKPLEYTEEQASKARALVLSGALTDIELLEKGKIIVVFDPETANVIEVFYGESEFYTEYLIPEANDPWMEQNMIGYYLGLYAPTPERRPALPHFSYAWKYDDELYLELKMLGTPDQTLLNKPLGLEVFARIPKVKKDGESSGAGSGSGGVQKVTEWDEILIYGEGYFASDYETKYADDAFGQKTIEPDYNGGSGLTLMKIQEGGGKLKFALDSMVIDKANYDNKDTKSKLHHSANPKNISVTEDVLYPRNSLADWLNPRRNPYLTVGMREYSSEISQELTSLITKEATNGANPTDFVKVTQGMSLHIKLHVLSDQPRAAASGTIGGSNGAQLYDFDDEHYVPFEVTAQTISPYFYALSDSANKATLSSIRDFNNLAYVFQSENKITEANLDDDISGQKFYEKLTSVRYALIDKYKDESIKSAWGHGANWDGVAVQQMYIENKKSGFTLSGKKPNGDGNYSIIDIAGGGRNYDLGGFFGYAENCTFKDLDIVNPVIWRNSYETTFIKTDDESGKISELNITKYPGGASGALVGVAVNCTFENVKVYIDSYHTTSITTYEDKPELRTLQNIPPHRVSGVVSGGIVGIAIGGTDTIDTSSVKATAETKGCTFKNCAVSHNVSSEFYNPAGSCVYAGGFVGIAMGDVTIQNSYAASQVYGYYAGGLVGAAANGKWSYKDNGEKELGKGEANGTLTISDSFAAGYIMHGVHVGAGLIAEVQDKEKVKVTDCYSTVGWDAFPPVAYGTFEGDTANYYVFPTKINLPLTVNVEAHFTCTGDIFSLQNGTTEGTTTGKCGIGCTEKELIKKLTEGESKDKWEKDATRTQQWKWRESKAPFYYEDGYTGDVHEDWGYLKSVKYPYPMPKGNDKFWGSWIEETCCDSTDEETPTEFSATFDGYFITYYERNVAEYGRLVDAGNIKTVDKIELIDGKAIMGGQPLSETWWAKTEGWTETFGQGKDGATDVSLDGNGDNGKLKFFGPAFYIKDFDPTKGYQFSPITGTTAEGTTEGIKLGGSQILWDFYGFYCLADCGSSSNIETKYYFKFDKNQEKGKATKGTEEHYGKITKVEEKQEDGKIVEREVKEKMFKEVVVNGDEFREAAHWATFEFDTSKIKIEWKDGHFAVSDGTTTGGTEFKASTAGTDSSEGVGA